jgi:hypothetical protein
LTLVILDSHVISLLPGAAADPPLVHPRSNILCSKLSPRLGFQ